MRTQAVVWRSLISTMTRERLATVIASHFAFQPAKGPARPMARSLTG
jgi:hypothetical protein